MNISTAYTVLTFTIHEDGEKNFKTTFKYLHKAVHERREDITIGLYSSPTSVSCKITPRSAQPYIWQKAHRVKTANRFMLYIFSHGNPPTWSFAKWKHHSNKRTNKTLVVSTVETGRCQTDNHLLDDIMDAVNLSEHPTTLCTRENLHITYLFCSSTASSLLVFAFGKKLFTFYICCIVSGF